MCKQSDSVVDASEPQKHIFRLIHFISNQKKTKKTDTDYVKNRRTTDIGIIRHDTL